MMTKTGFKYFLQRMWSERYECAGAAKERKFWKIKMLISHHWRMCKSL